MTTEEQNKNLVKLGKETLEESVVNSLGNIEKTLACINTAKNYIEQNLAKPGLRSACNDYIMLTENIEQLYSLKFPELQKQYEAMLPEINKFLNNNEEEIICEEIGMEAHPFIK